MIFNKTINCYYKKYWYCFFFGILFLILVDVTQLFLPKIIGDLVDAISDKTLTSEIIAKNVLVCMDYSNKEQENMEFA